MTRFHLSRRTVLALAAGGASAIAVAGGAFAPWRSRVAEAQLDPAEAVGELAPENDDPALTGSETGSIGLDSGPAAPATPVVALDPSLPAPEWVPTDAGMSTSLGGSDIAVASEGQSHQVDGPKRKVNKILGEKKRP